MTPIAQTLRRLALDVAIKPLARVAIGPDVIGAAHLPTRGPAIVAANHNSHLDTLALLAAFPSRLLPILRPVAAADRFLRDPVGSWFSRRVVGIIPLKRAGAAKGEDVLAEARAALAAGQILIVFPEGTRGAPEEMGAFKAGVARLAEACPEAPVTPVYIQGAGRALPRGSKVFVPFDVTIVAGAPFAFEARAGAAGRAAFVTELRDRIEALRALAPPLRWD